MASTDGFVKLPNWLIDDSNLSAHEMLVYTVLLRFRDPKTGKCFPGMTTIADRARISKRSVIRAIDSLEQRTMIRVERRSTITENKPNVYYVSVPSETRKHTWENSSRGQRIPKRRPSDSESPGKEAINPTSDSESPASDKTISDPVTPSHPNKIQYKKIQEQDMRRDLTIEPDNLFSFTVEQKPTAKQIDYLSDLYIFITGRVAEKRTREGWEALDPVEASKLIDTYWGQMDRGRGGMWESPVDEIHPAYKSLSQLGKRWITNGCLPDALEVA